MGGDNATRDRDLHATAHVARCGMRHWSARGKIYACSPNRNRDTNSRADTHSNAIPDRDAAASNPDSSAYGHTCAKARAPNGEYSARAARDRASYPGELKPAVALCV